jgi:hypothetical protein
MIFGRGLPLTCMLLCCCPEELTHCWPALCNQQQPRSIGLLGRISHTALLPACGRTSTRLATVPHGRLCLQAALSWWSVVSPFGGVGSTAALVFVLLVAGVKAVWEDTKRHQEDKRMNTSITHRVNPDGAPTAAYAFIPFCQLGCEACGSLFLSGQPVKQEQQVLHVDLNGSVDLDGSAICELLCSLASQLSRRMFAIA